jgi:hypothetical protein
MANSSYGWSLPDAKVYRPRKKAKDKKTVERDAHGFERVSVFVARIIGVCFATLWVGTIPRWLRLLEVK